MDVEFAKYRFPFPEVEHELGAGLLDNVLLSLVEVARIINVSSSSTISVHK